MYYGVIYAVLNETTGIRHPGYAFVVGVVFCKKEERFVSLYVPPSVVEVAVLPMPHKILGQDILAVVRLADGASLDLETAREFLRDRLADYKLPRRLEVRSEPLPRSGMGKVDKRALAASLGLSG